MFMKDAISYWAPLCGLVAQLRCWINIASMVGTSTQGGHWGQLLTTPSEGYLEASGGPIPLRDIEWIDISTKRIKGGIAGRPLQMIDAKDEILVSLQGTQLSWELRESMWSVDGVFEEEPVQVVRILNPFSSTAKP
jgi:hypothetical protein